MKQSKMPVDPNQRAKATVDAIDAILDRWPVSPPPPAKDPERVARGKIGGSKGGERKSPERPRYQASSLRASNPTWGICMLQTGLAAHTSTSGGVVKAEMNDGC